MDNREDASLALDRHEATQNGVIDESCVLIEQNISTIEIEDTILEDSIASVEETFNEETVDAESTRTITDEPEFQTIDQIEDSEEVSICEATIDLTDGVTNGSNGHVQVLNESSEFCAPNEVTAVEKAENAESKVLIDIKFLNKKTHLAFQEEFVTLIKNYYKSKIDDMSIVDDLSSKRIRVSEKLVKKSDDYKIDNTPNKAAGEESTPTYRKSFGATVLCNDKESEVMPRSSQSNSRNVCFNCEKDNHSLRDCPEPRNMKKVNKARNEFNKRELRYHDDVENDSSLNQPGKISDDLRNALGLGDNQLPMHVYRMRLFGYPPAWIEEAKIHNSGLSLFVDEDDKRTHLGAGEHEIAANDFKYDLQKIFDFPGFNTSPDFQYTDQWRMYGTPPMMPQHSKEAMIESLGEGVVNGYKKRKLRDSRAADDNDRTSTVIADMEIDDASDEVTLPLGVTVCNVPPLPDSSIVKPPEPVEIEDGECVELRSPSPNESDLKALRQKLLAEIADSSVFIDTSSINTSLSTTAPAVELDHSLDATIIENSENENRDNCAKDSESSCEIPRGHVDHSQTVLGCPVLPSFTPYNALPSGEKFQEGVCDVIAFENLAESTGKYERMKLLIKKVRVFQKDHQKE